MDKIIIIAKLDGKVVRRETIIYNSLVGWVRAFLEQGYTVEIKEDL